MKTNCECASRRAAESAAEVERLNVRIAEVTQKWNELLTSNGQVLLSNNELRNEFEQCRSENMALIASLDESLAREVGMREVVKNQQALLDGAQKALDTMAEQIRARDRQIAELRARLIENAEQARAIRIGVAA